MKSLFFVPIPYPDESPTSLLMRTAQKNGYFSVAKMCRSIKIEGDLHRIGMLTHQHAIFELLCQEAPPLAPNLREVFFPQPQKILLNTSKIFINNYAVPRRIFRSDFCPCPQCLADGYTRAPQDLKIFDDCPYHNLSLLKVCPQCGAHNKWYNLKNFHCSCGFNYLISYILLPQPKREILLNTSFGPHSARRILNNIHKNRNMRAAIFPNLIHTDEHSLCITEQIQELLTRELSTHRKLPLQVFQAPWLHVKDQDIRDYSLDFINRNHHQDKACNSKLCCKHIELSFDELSRSIDSTTKTRKLIHEKQVTPLRDFPSNIIYYHAGNLCEITNYKLSIQQNHKNNREPEFYSSLRQAANTLHTNSTALRELISARLIPGIITGDRAFFIPKNEIQKFRQKYIFATELAKTCGILTRSLTLTLKKMKLELAFPRATPSFPAIFHRNTIPKNLSNEINSFRRHRNSRADMGYKLVKELSSKIKLNIATTKFILSHICACTNPNWWISTSERNALVSWRKSHFTIKDVCALTKTHRLLINTRFIHSGLIKPTKIYRTNFITQADVKFITKHLKSYVSVIQSSKLFSVSESKIRKLIAQNILNTSILKHGCGHQQILLANNKKNAKILNEI
ncbi:hypothetical protein ACXPVS_25430 [Pseudomonas sp. Ma2-10]